MLQYNFQQDEEIQFIESFGFKTKETYSENEWIALIFEKGVYATFLFSNSFTILLMVE